MHFYYFSFLEGSTCNGRGDGLERLLCAYAQSVYVLGYERAFGCERCDLASVAGVKESGDDVVCVVWFAGEDSGAANSRCEKSRLKNVLTFLGDNDKTSRQCVNSLTVI
jgi:hypothetical protein